MSNGELQLHILSFTAKAESISEISRAGLNEEKYTMKLQQTDLRDLINAKDLLENPGVAAKISSFIGMPIEKGFRFLPDNWNTKIVEVTQSSLIKAAHTAVFTMKDSPGRKSSNSWHKLTVAATGGFGGFFGLPAMVIELPISITIMLRSIADIARSEKEDIFTNEAIIACIEVFTLGDPASNRDTSESGYFTIRAALARSVAEATEYMAKKSFTEKSAPALVRFIIQVAERFSIQVSEKAAAQAIPAIGAAGGAIINTLFINHFQDMARGHFTIRRLERKYGRDVIERKYREI